MIPFFAFALGTTLDLRLVWAAGLLGLLLGLVTLLVSGLVLATVDKLIGGNGTAGIAAATTAGNAAAVPMLIAAANPKYAAAARTATVLVASCVVVTSLLAPPLTAWWHAWVHRRYAGQMGNITMSRVLIFADDLSGAADCGIACVNAGLSTIVSLGLSSNGIMADVLSVDADTRSLSASDAAERMRHLVQVNARTRRSCYLRKLIRRFVGTSARSLQPCWRPVEPW